MKLKIQILLFTLAFNFSFSQSLIEEGVEGSDLCPGSSKPTYIVNQSSAVTINVSYKTLETSKKQIVEFTGSIKPNEKHRIGCSLITEYYEKKYSIEETIIEGIEEESNNEIRKKIIEGSKFKVIFDHLDCPYDNGWKFNNDPLGAVKCGNEYDLVYENNSWSVTGYHEWTNKTKSKIYTDANPKENRFNIWGNYFTFNEKGEVISEEYGVIGRIQF